MLKSYDNGTTVTNTYYIRDASGLIMATYTNETEGNPPGGGEPLVASLLPGDVKVKEWPMYGSGAQSRIGVREGRETQYTVDQPVKDVPKMTEVLGHKNYEITDHLGNVRVTFSDVHIEGGKLNITSNVDYYPFGMQKEAETYNQSGYTFGFNGMEKDDEVKGEGNSLDFGARIYDPRVGRFSSQDPKSRLFPKSSPYVFAANNPIRYIDVLGMNPGDVVEMADVASTFDNSKPVISWTVTIFVQQTDNPNLPFQLDSEGGYEAGHTFVRLEKRNTDGTIDSEIVGWYPDFWNKELFDQIDYPDFDGEFRDDTNTPYTQSLTIDVSEGEFKAVLVFLQEVEDKGEWVVTGMNCTAVAHRILQILNVETGSKEVQWKEMGETGESSLPNELGNTIIKLTELQNTSTTGTVRLPNNVTPDTTSGQATGSQPTGGPEYNTNETDQKEKK